MKTINNLLSGTNKTILDTLESSKDRRPLLVRSPNIVMHQLCEEYKNCFNGSRQLMLGCEFSSHSQWDRMCEDITKQILKGINQYLKNDQMSIHEALTAFREVFGGLMIISNYDEITKNEYVFCRAIFTSCYLS